MDEEFTTTAYPSVQENLKLPTEDHVTFEEPASSTGTLSSLQNLDKELSFTGQFFVEKPQEEEPEKTNAELEVQSMVTVPIHQDTFSVPPMTTPKSMDHDHSDQLQADLAKARKKRRKKSDSPRTPLGSPPPPPPSPGASGAPRASRALGSSQLPLLSSKISDTRDKPSGSSVDHLSPPDDQQMNDDPAPADEEHTSGDDDLGTVPKVPSCKDWWKPRDDDETPATPEPAWVILTSHIPDATFMNWYCQKVGKTELTQAYFEGQAYEVLKAFYPDVIHLQFQMEECHKMLTDQIDWANPEGDQVRIDISRPLPLSGLLGHVTIQTQFFFNKDLDYLRYGSRGSRPALSISKMKVARYPDFGLKLLVVKTHMRILSVVRINAYSHYRYDYLKEITLRRADYQEYTIAEKDFKNLYPSDFEDLNLLLLQGHLNHLPSLDKRTLSTAINLWTRNLYKHDYTIIESPRAVVFPVRNNERKIMRFNEIYKFSDGTLTNILEALDYRVKEYKVNRLNPGMNTRFWTAKDVTRSKEFIHAIERRLKTRRIFRNLECFVGGRVRDIDYRLLQRTE
ncbi:hypothetical protein Tco_0723043 [Tanacetum coccineum]